MPQSYLRDRVDKFHLLNGAERKLRIYEAQLLYQMLQARYDNMYLAAEEENHFIERAKAFQDGLIPRAELEHLQNTLSNIRRDSVDPQSQNWATHAYILLISRHAGEQFAILCCLSFGIAVLSRKSLKWKALLMNFILDQRDSLPLPPFRYSNSDQMRASRSQPSRSIAPLSFAQLGHDTVEADVKDLLGILAFMGENLIPDWFLKSMAEHQKGWASDGEVETYPPNVAAVLKDSVRCFSALAKLKQGGFIQESLNALQETGYIVPNPGEVIREAFQSDTWKLEAVKAVFHGFPIHRDLDPTNYVYRGKSLLPLLQHTVHFLDDIDINNLPFSLVIRFSQVCLSASYMAELSRKSEVLKRIHQALSHAALFEAKLRLRTIQIARINGARYTEVKEQLEGLKLYPRLDNRSSAFVSEVALLHARFHIDQQQHTTALEILKTITPLTQPESKLERIMIHEQQLLSGKILRYQGKYREAGEVLGALLAHGCAENSTLMSKVTSQLAFVHCGQNRPDHAIMALQSELEMLSTLRQPLDGLSARRLKLELAEAHLFKFLSSTTFLYQHKSAARTLFEELSSRFDTTVLGKVGKMQRFRTLTGLAILSHLAENSVCHAMHCWDVVSAASKACGWPVGQSDVVIALSRADLAFQSGTVEEGDRLRRFAYDLRNRSGKVQTFTCLETLWVEKIEERLAAYLILSPVAMSL